MRPTVRQVIGPAALGVFAGAIMADVARSEPGVSLAVVAVLAAGVGLLVFLFSLAVVLERGVDGGGTRDLATRAAALRDLVWPPTIAADLRGPDAPRGRQLAWIVLKEVGFLLLLGAVGFAIVGGDRAQWFAAVVLSPAIFVAWRLVVLVWIVATGRFERPPPTPG